MSRFVVDACVAIKWVVAEEHSVAALRIPLQIEVYLILTPAEFYRRLFRKGSRAAGL